MCLTKCANQIFLYWSFEKECPYQPEIECTVEEQTIAAYRNLGKHGRTEQQHFQLSTTLLHIFNIVQHQVLVYYGGTSKLNHIQISNILTFHSRITLLPELFFSRRHQSSSHDSHYSDFPDVMSLQHYPRGRCFCHSGKSLRCIFAIKSTHMGID